MQVRYNRALDLTALAFREARAGNRNNASFLFAAATRDRSSLTAMKMIEATNAHAIAASKQTAKAPVKAKAKAAVKAKRKVRANDMFEETDSETMDVLEQLEAEFGDAEDVEEIDVEEVEAEEDLDEVEEPEVEDIEIDARAQARSFQRVLSRLYKKGK